MSKIIKLLILFSWHICISLKAQIYDENIRTVQLYKEGWELSAPIIYLYSNDKLILEFDDLSSKYRNLWYSFEHCDRNWNPDDLSYNEFYQGFETNPIENFNFSRNTVVNYIHYRIKFPNENCNFITSGNYYIKVFEDNNPEKLLLKAKFYIVENRAQIILLLLRPEIPRFMQHYQQFKITIIPNCSDAQDLRSEITTYITQNLNPHILKECKLTELKNNQILIYDDLEDNNIPGGNEFRFFDTKNFRSVTPRIQSFSYLNQYYEINLIPDEWRYKKRYSSETDINGKYIIANQSGKDKTIDADYVMVHFKLPTPEPLMEGELYILGELNQWQTAKMYRLNYDYYEKAYTTSLLLKQGYYNYQFAYKTTSGNIDFSYVEGNHYETENDYYIFVYFKATYSRYERLIGFAQANSIRK